MDAIAHAASGINCVLALLGAAAIVVTMPNVCLDVALRNFFRSSFTSANAMVARYCMTRLAFLPPAHIELQEEMVAVELIDGFLSDQLLQAPDVVVAVIGCAIYGVPAWATRGSLLSNWRRGTMIELGETGFLTYPSHAFPTAGLALATAARALKALGRARDRPRPVNVGVGFAGVGVLIGLLRLRVPVAMALVAVSLGGVATLVGVRPAVGILYSTPYDFVASWTLSAKPMFLPMGIAAFHAMLTGGPFEAAKVPLGRLPGGLAISSVFACSSFAAVSGSALPGPSGRSFRPRSS